MSNNYIPHHPECINLTCPCGTCGGHICLCDDGWPPPDEDGDDVIEDHDRAKHPEWWALRDKVLAERGGRKP